jgi:ATP-binding protein involved in chromosome partitioning
VLDPRTSVIETRLALTRRIIAVSSGKGGVGKSMIATTLALSLAQEGCRVGLFDLDFTGPSTHIILGIPKTMHPTEEKGIVPPIVNGLEYMSLVYFVGENPSPLRGLDVSNALIELLAVTQWGKLDFLIIDLPPGIGDAVLDLIRFVKRIEFIIISTPSLLAFEVVKKQTILLCELCMPIIGVLENMQMTPSDKIKHETENLGLEYLGAVPYDPEVEAAIGKPAKLLSTDMGKTLNQLLKVEICKGKSNCPQKR